MSESRANGYQGRYQQSQRTMLEWQNKCHELEQQLEDARKAAAAAAIGSVSDEEETVPPAAEPAAFAPQAPEEPAPAQAQPQPDPEPVQAPDLPPAAPVQPDPLPQARPAVSATVEARKILADARITAENVARRMRQEAEEQKARMAENARDLAAGVQVLRDRLSRVDEKLSAASLDLENATGAIYQALDDTEAELKELGTEMRDFAQGTPEWNVPEPAQPEQKKAATPQFRVKATAQPVRSHRSAQQAPAKPAGTRRLRNAKHPVSQMLQNEIDKIDDQSKT